MTIRGNIQDFADAAKDVTKQGGGKDFQATIRILDEFDNWMDRIESRRHDQGAEHHTATGLSDVDEGRQAWGLAERTRAIERVVERAQSKRGFGNARYAAELRKGFQKLLDSERDIRWFSAADRRAIRSVARGGNWGRVLGTADALLPSIPTSRGGLAKAVGYGSVGYAIPGVAPVIGTLGAIGTAVAHRPQHWHQTAATRAVNQVRGGQGVVPYNRAAAAASQDYATRLTQAMGQPAVQRLNGQRRAISPSIWVPRSSRGRAGPSSRGANSSPSSTVVAFSSFSSLSPTTTARNKYQPTIPPNVIPPRRMTVLPEIRFSTVAHIATNNSVANNVMAKTAPPIPSPG